MKAVEVLFDLYWETQGKLAEDAMYEIAQANHGDEFADWLADNMNDYNDVMLFTLVFVDADDYRREITKENSWLFGDTLEEVFENAMLGIRVNFTIHGERTGNCLSLDEVYNLFWVEDRKLS